MEQAEKLLPIALEYGIEEIDFWNMTPAEIDRLIRAKKNIQLREARERASADYILADLIGKSIARIYSNKNKFPPIEKVYPTLFDEVEIKQKKQEQKDKLSVIRFKQFADAFNKKFKEANKT